MDWYKNMPDKQKKDFNKVVIACAAGAVLASLEPVLLNLVF